MVLLPCEISASLVALTVVIRRDTVGALGVWLQFGHTVISLQAA
jgi:hypothetical protein